MNPVFSINFRREAYLKERARTRQRVVALGVWVAYFGIIVVVLGLYGLNCASLTRRAGQLTNTAARLQASQSSEREFIPAAPELAEVQRYAANPWRWHERLARLAAVLPPNAALASVEVNPDIVSGSSSQERLIITGTLKPQGGRDRMESVMRLVSALHSDSAFAAAYKTIRLASSRISGGSEAEAEFVIECR